MRAPVDVNRPRGKSGAGAYNGAVSYRDERGVVYDPVPLPTHEVTDAVALDARLVRRPAEARKAIPFYTGTDGVELAQQPPNHRRRWSEEQWLAFQEHRKLEEEASHADEPQAAVWVVRDR